MEDGRDRMGHTGSRQRSPRSVRRDFLTADAPFGFGRRRLSYIETNLPNVRGKCKCKVLGRESCLSFILIFLFVQNGTKVKYESVPQFGTTNK